MNSASESERDRMMNLKYLIGSILILTTLPTTALSQMPTTQSAGSESLPEAYERAFFRNAPNFYRERSLPRQLNFMFGIGSFTRSSFPENEYIRDANLINTLYQDTLQQQVGSSPTLRTPDLPNPYSSSLFTSPPLEEVEPPAEDAAPPENTQPDNEVEIIPVEPDTQPEFDTIPVE